MSTLLERTRQVNRLLQKAAGRPVDLRDMAEALSDLIACNVYIVNRQGRVLGHGLMHQFECEILREEVLDKDRFPEDYNQKILKMEESSPNIRQGQRRCVFNRDKGCIYEEKVTTIVPINGGGERLGTLLLARYGSEFTDEDLVLTEYAATVVAMEMLRTKTDALEEEARKKAAVQVAIGTLSFSELEAVRHIFDELKGREGFLVASKIADRVGITRSVIVNALRKFESAGVIESRSLGMKGTYIRVLNERLLEELNRIKAQRA
ncbi:MAG TPA: GTP-sensing pleiotropic transcriptional regulator CodY [Firmicutes bacterium]|nr:GTP-sensing pleiotropic transcriptional regulator CodY [Bacillota bacterium]